MLSCLWLTCIYLVVQVVQSEEEHTAANYLYNVDIIITRQLENPLEEDAEDLKDNVEEYLTVLGDLLNSIQRKDRVGIVTAKQYWKKGLPHFFNEENNGDLFNKLTREFDWPNKAARDLTNLIYKAKVLWYSFDAWYKNQVTLSKSV